MSEGSSGTDGRSRALGRALRIAASALLLWLVLRQTRLEEVAQALAGLELGGLLLAVAILAVDRALVNHKWWLLLRAQGFEAPWLFCLRVYLASTFMGLLLPSTLGADAIRAAVVTRRTGRGEGVVASILVERLLGSVTLVLLAAGGGLLLWRSSLALPEGVWTGVVIGLLAIAGVTLAAAVGIRILTSERLDAWLRARERHALARVFRARAHGFAEAVLACTRSRAALARFLALAAAVCLLEAVQAWVVADALGTQLPLAVFVAVVPVILLLVRVPVSVAGFGVYEAGFVYFLGQLGVAPAQALAIGLLFHGLGLASALPGALFLDVAARARPAGDGARG